MIELKGRYNTAKVYTDNVDNSTISQLVNLLNEKSVEGSQIRIMPDCHAGAGCVIGTTMTLKDKVIPNLVGVDIGCGMYVIKLKETHIELPKLDSVIHSCVPSGGNVHESGSEGDTVDLKELRCIKMKARVRLDLAYCSVGTLGGGNHFIEVDKGNNEELYLVIHTGSRHLGLEVANFYQNEAYKRLKFEANGGDIKTKTAELIEKLKASGDTKNIQQKVTKFRREYAELNPKVPYELAYCADDLFDDYIHDMNIVQRHAHYNRLKIARVILKNMKLHAADEFETIHNYIDTTNMILRKGSVSARAGERLIIPMNMRDGSLICVGKGNPDWNYSAPHGAGRLMSRSQAKDAISMVEFRKSMEGIYTTCVDSSTLDESPMAYKPMDEIIANVKDTVDIIDKITPVYNFKASDED